MGVIEPLARAMSDSGGVFASEETARFAAAYPETPTILRHGLRDHALLTLPSLARLAKAITDGLHNGSITRYGAVMISFTVAISWYAYSTGTTGPATRSLQHVQYLIVTHGYLQSSASWRVIK